ncbi:MAG: hypothetical protein EAZ47_11700 [Bacteroidetes bacterium]|nr:MAG: hypothetical protein EAY72_10690 [Bacteroidota bacterium]TAE61692.1 MAG: hypothetical protein EAY68_09730 [Bacteroidota bacterium]TAF89387.1 MAG: hypothetical protein EAZ47_11700 [Bacteroidota bacterium]
MLKNGLYSNNYLLAGLAKFKMLAGFGNASPAFFYHCQPTDSIKNAPILERLYKQTIYRKYKIDQLF